MDTFISFVDAELFSQFQRRVMDAGISKTSHEENKLKWADSFLEYCGINIWDGDNIATKLHLYTLKA